jgi:hypothetical protein
MPDFGDITLEDTVQFTLKPYRLSFQEGLNTYLLFWKHVIGKEVECALKEAMEGTMHG